MFHKVPFKWFRLTFLIPELEGFYKWGGTRRVSDCEELNRGFSEEMMWILN